MVINWWIEEWETTLRISKSALKNQGMSLQVERSKTKQSQEIEGCLHSDRNYTNGLLPTATVGKNSNSYLAPSKTIVIIITIYLTNVLSAGE